MGEEFQSFLKQNGVKHPTSAPHHPATNGLAERFVQSFKQSMKASGKDGSVATKSGKLPAGLPKHSSRHNRPDAGYAVHGQEPEIAFGFAQTRHPQTCAGETVLYWPETNNSEHSVSDTKCLPETTEATIRNGSLERFCHSQDRCLTPCV